VAYGKRNGGPLEFELGVGGLPIAHSQRGFSRSEAADAMVQSGAGTNHPHRAGAVLVGPPALERGAAQESGPHQTSRRRCASGGVRPTFGSLMWAAASRIGLRGSGPRSAERGSLGLVASSPDQVLFGARNPPR